MSTQMFKFEWYDVPCIHDYTRLLVCQVRSRGKT